MTSPRRRTRPQGLSLRWRLTLSYAAFLFVSGSAFFALVFLLLHYVPDESLSRTATGQFAPNRSDLLDALVPYALLGLGFFAVIGLLGGWLLAGHVLRPVHQMRGVAMSVGEGAWSNRIDLPGRRDELSDLADSFDDMLDRLERSYEEQRRFTANASHELRTPHAVMRTLLDVAAAEGPALDAPQLVARMQTTNDRAIDLVEALLVLSRANAAELAREPCDLAELVAAVLLSHHAEIADRGLVLYAELESAPFLGEPVLMSQLIGNLVKNATVHNAATDGWLGVRTQVDAAGMSTLTVENAGPLVPPELMATITEPFVRGAGRTSDPTGGVGLGLAIVASIARAHDGELVIRPLADGGLTVGLRLVRSG